ncbi:MAG TPA: sensor histidine kinase, partial [Kofleriaceae bacterium]
VAIAIRDTGRGMPAEEQRRVFEPFYSRKAAGTGLGLTIAREAAQSLGGALALDDTASGCAMAVVLPIARPEDGE